MHDKVKILKKTLAVFVAASAVISMFVCCLSVNAAVAYNGSGTKSDPFIGLLFCFTGNLKMEGGIR